MPRPSTVAKLPPPIRERIGELLGQHVSLDDILAALKPLGDEASAISRSALGRYAKKIGKVGERMRRSRDIADALVQRLGDAPENKLAAVNIELVHSLIFNLVAGGEGDEPVTLDPKDAMFVAQSIKSLTDARMKDADYTLKIRAATEKRTKDAAAKAMDAVAKQHGLTAGTVEAIKSQILGVKVPA
jgi:hypothetical protein